MTSKALRHGVAVTMLHACTRECKCIHICIHTFQVVGCLLGCEMHALSQGRHFPICVHFVAPCRPKEWRLHQEMSGLPSGDSLFLKLAGANICKLISTESFPHSSSYTSLLASHSLQPILDCLISFHGRTPSGQLSIHL